MRNNDGNLIFESMPHIASFASVVGKKEGEGPLRDYFDRIIHDSYAGKDTFEQAESELMSTAVRVALNKGDFTQEQIDLACCGDLLNQCVASSFAMRSYAIPYAGVYGACSTMALSMILSAIVIESGAAKRAVCAASSHYCTAERQYRFPLEYGSQRPPTAQWTVTGSGACILEKAGNSDQPKAYKADKRSKSFPSIYNDSHINESHFPCTPYLHAARFGRIIDFQITDQNNMGAAMAPAAADTIYRYLSASETEVEDYDMIFTGDLGRVGTRLLHDLLSEKGVDLGERHSDCGVMIFDEDQDVHAGGSGCGCCASVLCGYILDKMREGTFRNILFIPTGALLSPTTVMQKQTIPSIAHLINIRAE